MKVKENKKMLPALFVLAALTAVFLPGCSEKGTAAGRGDDQKKPVKFDLIFKPFSYTTILTVVAEEAGYYDEYGLDSRLNPFNGTGIDELNAVSAEKLNVSTSASSNSPLQYIEQGNDLVMIGGIMSGSGALIGLPENASLYRELTTETLRGKKIGVQRASTSDVALRSGLAKLGVDLSQIEFIPLDSAPTIIESIRKKTLDLGTTQTTYRSIAEEQGLAIIRHLDELLPDYICCRVFTTRRQLDDDRDRFVAFLKANIRAYKFYLTEPEETLKIAVKYYNVDESLLKNHLYEYGHIGYHPDPLKNRVLELYDGLVDIGYINGGADLESHIDTSLYEEALNQILEDFPGDPVYLDMKKYFEENN
jgi:NitT/TauT family transport system substrate-binding protein